MTYREPYQNRKLHQNSVHSANMNNNAASYVPKVGGDDFGDRFDADQHGGQPSNAGNRPMTPLQANQDVIDPDQLLNGASSQMYANRVASSAFGNARSGQMN